MQKLSTCLGCRTFFQQNQTLPLECMTFEYKNFSIPLLQPKHKWNILKTIVSFLNTKGGIILIGIQDSDCRVVGKQLSGKARDEFKLYLLSLIERIQPQIDLNIKEELSVQYVPVVKKKVFTGKYVTKIIAQQGDPSQTYCFSQKLQWAPEGKKEIENQCQNVQIVYSFVRHNMGGTRQIKGMKLIQEATKKAQNPTPKFNTFHEQCNPQPPSLQVQTTKIGFKNIGNRQARRKFQRIFKQSLEQLKAEQFQIAYDTEFKAVIIQLPTPQQFRRINNFIKTNLSSLNESYEEVRFVECGAYLGVHFYQNANYNSNEQKPNNSPIKQKPQKSSIVGQQKVQKKKQHEKIQQVEIKRMPKQQKSQTQNQEQATSLTFTHINPNIKDKLLNYLCLSISKKIQTTQQMYQNTIQLFFNSIQDVLRYSQACFQPNNLRALQSFGFNKEIRIGVNTGHLHILNYDKSKENKVLCFLKFLMQKDLKQIQVLKKGNRYIIDCKMSERSKTCEWLDKLLVNKALKQYRIPGAQNGSMPKMKVFIHCEQVKV